MTAARLASLVAVVGCASAPGVAPDGGAVAHPPHAPQLARFMREQVNVPYSFAMMATATRRPHRVHRAALVLRDAAHSLADWSDPPAASTQGRDVFYAYAQNLAYHVQRLEIATQARDATEAADSLEQIRQTCNSCHNYFRPASRISRDVYVDYSVYGRIAADLPGGER